MKGLGMEPESPPKGNMVKMFGVSFMMAIIIAYNLNQWASYHPVEEQTFIHGAFHAILTCAMGALPVLVTNSLYEQRSWAVIFINIFYWAVTFALMGGILYMWPQAELLPPPPIEEGEAILRILGQSVFA